jgi:hypothetical protein
MRILIDECLPRKLKPELTDHMVSTVQEMGWSGVKNGKLLRLMVGQFEVFVTIDGNLTYQQNLSNVDIIVIVLKAANSKIESLLPLMPAVREALKTLKAGTIARFEDTSS